MTTEPPPEAPARRAQGDKPLFMVHKHDATRLHYDLRLELEGVLASWAIPKGPSYDHSIKRLAVQTEDHPLEYGNFEGRIPDGEYGAGDSIIWDRGSYDTVPPGEGSRQRERGRMLIELHGEKLKGRWHLVRTRPASGGKQQWLLFKAQDGEEDPDYDVVAERPESVLSGRRVTRGPVTLKQLRGPHPSPEVLLKKVWPPMRATLSTPERAEADEYFYEVKYDGYRGIAALSGGRVALDARGISRYQLLMTGAEERYELFDLLWLDGEDLRKRPIEDRRELLQSVLANVPLPIELTDLVKVGSVEEALEQARRRGLEGVIAKRRGSPYLSGARGAEWLKLKLNASQELAIVGYTPYTAGPDAIGALLLAVHQDGAFHYAGKVGTGYTGEVRTELKTLLEPDRVEKPEVVGAPRMRDAHWVRPRYAAQVSFTEWTRDGRLRHPSFQGLRMDKRPEECRRELPEAPTRGEVRARAKRAARTAREPVPAETRPRRATAKAIEVPLTSADRVLFPESGFTKRDVYEYYRAVAEAMVPVLAGRALAIEQFHKGIRERGVYRHELKAVPEWVTRREIQHERRTIQHVVVDRPETLSWLANQSALTLHMWNCRADHPSEPDWVVFDLDPAGSDRKVLITVAQALKGLLDELGLLSIPKTSGKRGLHVYVPMARGHTHQDAIDFAVAVTRVLEKGLPKLTTTERALAKRGGRLYLDAFQNGCSKTMVAPYSIRPLEGAPVSAPLRWSEVTEGLDPLAYNIRSMPRRLAEVGNLFLPALNGNQRLPRIR